jgi:hypothetical protein
MPVILATQEAEIGRMEVRSQPETLSQNTQYKIGLVERLKW